MSKEQLAKSYEIYAYTRGLNSFIENDLAQSLKKHEISLPSFRTLWILYFEKKMTMTDLNYIAQTNFSNAFRQVTKLKEEGLIEIEIEKDSRMKLLTLTEAGRQIVRNFIEEHILQSDLQILKTIEKISQQDLSIFIKVASQLSSELIGSPYTEWVIKSTKSLLEDTK
ncbi:MarR family winged helix-turn-helix transcriptional regulator [Alkalihalobacterium chitinilyticum]|uniref:MarR family transcriptional regulator n=1 Tax=Alkalihalobacterium chitinilyticum TaxID=2980103 RepID=A0ABT5V8J3_9BACI|nr:MarR family transcriptional regulator [Alkalihalobacterium chitinilyticum]MDE5411787.1 MarR family transcriptional regulator [Alkalihalobacterium chitinilyticum]